MLRVDDPSKTIIPQERVARIETEGRELTARVRSDDALVVDLHEEQRRRLGLFCILFCCLFLSAWTVPRALGIFSGSGGWLADGAGFITLGVVAGFWLLVRRKQVSTRVIFGAAVWLQPIIAFGVVATEGASYVARASRGDVYMTGTSWVAVLIVLFPIIVPSSMIRTAVSGFLSALAVPVFYVLASLMTPGGSEWVASAAIRAAVGPFACLIPALLINHVFYNVSRKLTNARKIGVYQLREKLGQGGMGEVWHAVHQGLARPTAIKLIRPEPHAVGVRRSVRALKRFEREAQSTAQLTCPHTITVFDFGIAQDGTFFYVMELLHGVDLDTLVQQSGPQPAERVVHFLKQVCHSLQEAHSAGFIHRDIKPANLFCCRYGGVSDFIKVLDFGLVAEATGSDLDDPRRFAGTPAYVSPEAVLGEAPVAPAQDIYSLGCVAYWLLVGEPLVTGRNAMQVALKHVSDDPIRPSQRLGQPVHPGLESLVMRCLSKQPELRPTARELRAALSGLSLCWTDDDADTEWRRRRTDAFLAEVADTEVQPTL